MIWCFEDGGEKRHDFPKTFFLQYNLIGVSYGHDFLPKQRVRLNGSSRFLECVRKAYKKFLGALEKTFQLKTWGFVRIFWPDFELHFQNLNFFAFPDI